MPSYDYHCAANGLTVEVKHRMSEEVTTWGDVCRLAGMEVADTPADSPVAKVLRPTMVASRDNLGCDARPAVVGGCGHAGSCFH